VGGDGGVAAGGQARLHRLGPDPELAREIDERDANSRYLASFTLPSALKATADLEKAVHDVDLLVVGVPTHGFRAILADARPYLRPWIPVVSWPRASSAARCCG